MGEIINGYVITKKLDMTEGGMCRWGFAEKDGREYFIKEFLSPKYPLDESIMGPEITRQMQQAADKFERDRRAYYGRLKECRTGNNIIVLDFFRNKTKYYAVTDKVSGKQLTVVEVAALTADQKYTLIKSLLYSIAKLHEARIVHSDLKPENILIQRTTGAYCTAKIIDFDAGYLESLPPETILGSQNYFSPEAVMKIKGNSSSMTAKSDVFALGLLLHQYWCGEMPKFSEEYHYAAEAVLQNSPLQLSESIPEELRKLIASMLCKYYAQRPTAREAWKSLCEVEEAPDDIAVGDSSDVIEEPVKQKDKLCVSLDDCWKLASNDDLL